MTHVGADETLPYDDMYAVWQEVFYVYHSGVAGDGNLETVDIPKNNGTYDLTQNLTAGTLYGGYYLDYAGKGSYKDDGVKADDGEAYTADQVSTIKWSDPQTVCGKAITPAAGETYYIKEVPDTYLRPAQITTYQRYDGYLRDFILLSTTDDRNYKTMGFKVGASEFEKEFFTDQLEISFGPNYDGTVKDGKVTLTVHEANSSLDNGYIFSYRLFSVNEANPDYKDIVGTKLIKPYWVTPDGVKVVGAAMRRQVVTDKNDSGKIEVIGTDADKQEIVWTDYKIKSILSVVQ